MTYQEAVQYLYSQMPLFQNIGSKAYKDGLNNSLALDSETGHPHRRYKTIHVAGSNGKGSVSHTLAAILQSAGYTTGLYTSPHILDFRERIRVDGKPVPENFVIDFVEKHATLFEILHPSFFEVTTAMAFSYFSESKVDVAVIEVGLGGRLDCTNIINPDLSIITNISFDHVNLLGSTLPKIAAEKAGIIKPNTPVIIGESLPETKIIFEKRAKQENAPIIFAQNSNQILSVCSDNEGNFIFQTPLYHSLLFELQGEYQLKNANTILNAICQLQNIGYNIPESAVRNGFGSVCKITGLKGRWQTLAHNPLIICDTGHNVQGFEYISKHLNRLSASPGFGTLRIVLGMVNDKDIEGILNILPKNAFYYFTQPSVQRSLDFETLAKTAYSFGLKGIKHPSVKESIYSARKEASANDIIFVGGSTFVVADLLNLPEFS
ncbi:MAG TPA: folylpolyglutamate synthase/dihydrofolate synthase family protein [Bacteroidaceae bacterium]|nr:folylpolyglutamate synthase/dihydrofolate synthase family protein [Bacteroidaceae bacterium]